MEPSCRETVLRVGVALVFLYLTGFLALYWAIRKLICVSVDCTQYFYPLESPVYGLDLFVEVFVGGTLLLTVLLYLSAHRSGDKEGGENGC